MPKRTKNSKRKLKKWYKTLGTFQKQGLGLISGGLILIVVFSGWRIRELTRLSFKGQMRGVNQESQISRVKIDKVGLDLAVEPAVISDGTWEVSDKGVSHWSNSANPGQGGNIVIYGHNKNNLFGPIRWLSLGDKIEITDKNENKYEYIIKQIVTTNPDDIEYVLPTNEETLTLYTCTGFLDRQRYVVVAKAAGI